MFPKITVITVSFNARETITRTIESVVSQKYPDMEYIIIDGNSSDGTQAIVTQYLSKISKFISEPDTGIYNAMNKGIKLASGEFIYFLGADDYLGDDEVMTDVAEFLVKHPSCKFLYGNIEVRSSGKINHIYKPVSPKLILDDLITGCLPHQASFAHKSLFDDPEIGLFNEQYRTASDYEWFIKMATKLSEQLDTIMYMDRVIASYNADGSSGNLGKMSRILTEVFAVQNRAPIYQTDYWLKRRIEKYQQILIEPQGQWGLYRQYSTPVISIQSVHKIFTPKSLKMILETAKCKIVGIIGKIKKKVESVFVE